MINKISEYDTTILISTNPPVVSTRDTEDFDYTLTNKVSYSSDSSDLSCSKSLQEIFENAASTYQIPLNLLKAVAKAESDFDPNCTSSSGAMGIMQLMPETAKSLGVTDAYDPEQNIMAGAKYLAENLKRYNGDKELALAAYNAGPGAVKKYNGIPPYKETQNYVKKVLAYMNENVSVPDVTVETNNNSYENAPTPLSKTEELSTSAKKALQQLSASSDTRIMSRLFLEVM